MEEEKKIEYTMTTRSGRYVGYLEHGGKTWILDNENKYKIGDKYHPKH